MPLNNATWSAVSGQTLTYDPPAQADARDLSWGSESGSSKLAFVHSTAASSSSHFLSQSFQGQSRSRTNIQGGEDYRQSCVQLGQPNHVQYQQQQYPNSIHGPGSKISYATMSDHRSEEATAANSGDNNNRVFNSSNKSYQCNPSGLNSAEDNMGVSGERIIYLKKQFVSNSPNQGSFIQQDTQQYGQHRQHHQSASSVDFSQGLQNGSSPGLDGHSLYCTEVLPVTTPPSQPITVEGGGNSGRGLLSINGGTSVSQSQPPVQYTIVLADPPPKQHQHQQGILDNGITSALIPSHSLPAQQQQQQQGYPIEVRGTSQAPGLPTAGTTASSFLINSDEPGHLTLLNTSNVSTALLAYPVNITGANSQSLLVKRTAENGSCVNLTSDKKSGVKEGRSINDFHHQTLKAKPSGSGHASVVESPQIRLVQLPETGHGVSTATSSFLLLTYAPAGSGNIKGAGHVTVTDIASLAQIQGLTVSKPNSVQFEPKHQTKTSSSSSTFEICDNTNIGGFPKTNSLTLSSARLSRVEAENIFTASQESNLSNHIRVLSAKATCCSSSSSPTANPAITTTCLIPPALISPGSRGVWTSLARSSSPVASESSPLSADVHQINLNGLRVSSSPVSPCPQQVTPQQPLKLWHGANSASDGALEGMHSGRAGQTGSGQHPNSSNTGDSSTNSSSSNTTSSSGINQQQRTNSPSDLGPGSNPSKPTSSSSPASSTSGSTSPALPVSHPRHRLPQPLTTSLGMLSAGPPSIPAGIFRTGGESPSGSPRVGSSSGGTSYSSSPYSSLYGGLHGQQAPQSSSAHSHPHLAGLAPYHTFFPSSAASAGSLHAFGPGALMIPPASSTAGGAAGVGHNYPRIESYSAVLASMGSQALQASVGPALDRSVHGPSPGVALPSAHGRGSSPYIPASGSRPCHSFIAGGITTGMPSPSLASSPPSSNVHRRLSGGSSSPIPAHGTSNTNNGGVVLGSRLSPLDKMAAMKAGGVSIGRENSSRHAFDLPDERGSRRSPTSQGPKVSFDSVVKEFGGDSIGTGSDSPPTPGYTRASLSGKEGSLKHRILIRPSDSEPLSGEDSPGLDQERRASQHQHLRDEPVPKRAKYPSSSSSPLSPTPQMGTSGVQSYHGGREESMRGNSSRAGHHPPHTGRSGSTNINTNHSNVAAYHASGGLASQAGTSHLSSPPHTQYHPPHHLHHQPPAVHCPQQQQQQQQHHYHGQPPQDDISGNNNTTTINKNTRDSNTSGSGIQHQPHSGYQGMSSAPVSSGRRRSSNSPPASTACSPTPPPNSSSSSHLQYPQHFMKGSIIQLANGSLKRVEDLQTEDFVSSAQISSDLKVDSSTVVRIEEHLERGTAMLSFSVGEHRVQVTVEATLEHPFFVFGQGWSSCSVTRTLARYGLDCQKLKVGDVCISLTHKDVSLNAADISQQQQQQQHNNTGDGRLGPRDFKASAESCDQTVPAVSSTTASSTHCVISTSSSLSSPPLSVQSKAAGSVMTPLKIDTKSSSTYDLPVLPPPSSSPSVLSSNNKRQQQQHELPPPQSNFVPVKKESSGAGMRDHYPHHYHHHHSRRRSIASSSSGGTPPAWQRTQAELSSVECKEELDAGTAAEDGSRESLSRKRRWSAPDPGLVKVEKERERERQSLADQAQRLEEMTGLESAAPSRQGEESSVTDESPSSSLSPPPVSLSTSK